MNDLRVGIGYDVHRLEEGRPLILGGVRIEHPKGLAGHSDADVLIHAIIDGLLGALALGDIGQHFPDDEAAYKNINSRELLRKTVRLIRSKGWQVNNIDATVVAEAPRLAPHIMKMRKNLAEDFEVPVDHISVKATTGERLGFEGTGRGISVRAVVMVRQ